MPDGTSDSWGYGYLKDVYNHISDFDQAIATLSSVIKSMEHYRSRLTPIPGKTQELWDDYWHTERLIEGINTTIEEYDKTIEALTTARDNLKRLVEATRYCKSHNWFKKSDAKRADDTLKAIFTLGSSGSIDDSKNSSYP
jgi:hypothetical protein